ncbi:YaiO family outer membrane beta-barrel protein [Tenacibaculum dicentrarchi]|uniref:YaiO family outer membrane beta-barrel protein n=1 Tax=Tenacibaculum dicentrarchi TaxID=669041 RepID=UPI0035186C46
MNFTRINLRIHYCLIIFFYLFNCFSSEAQKDKINVDSLYYKANNLYKKKANKEALNLVNTALNIAPNYIDIRVLRIRISQRLHKTELVNNDLKLLLKSEKPRRLKNDVIRQLSLIKNEKILAKFIADITAFYKEDIDVDLSKAEAYYRLKNSKNTKEVLSKIAKNKLNIGQKYRYRLLLKKVNTNQISVYYNASSFGAEYPTKKTWHTKQLEYMKFVGAHSFGVRVTHSKRFTNDAILYELESYPVFSKKCYSYVNVSTSSNADFFQKLGIKASVYYSVLKGIEMEVGFRYLTFDTVSFTTYIVGITSYVGDFYLNAGVFIGPEIASGFIQNYQTNIRYYYSGAENYIAIRLGTGISPDEPSKFIPVVSNINLNSYYATIGVTKTVTYNYNVSANIGYLIEEFRATKKGSQFLVGIGLKYRF